MVLSDTEKLSRANYRKYKDTSKLDNKSFHEFPELLDMLLQDRTTNDTIIFATDNYEELGDGYGAKDHITVEKITGDNKDLIIPRAMKPEEVQKKRIKAKAEVFTPLWIIKKMNDAVDEDFQKDDLDTYINRTWLEITCGEAPYMTSRYDMYTNERVDFENRAGFVDRKLEKLHKAYAGQEDKLTDYMVRAKASYIASFGYEWQGDSLLLARENLLLTFIDYYYRAWGKMPAYKDVFSIAQIITYNVVQMDGLRFIIPMSSYEKEVPDEGFQFPGLPVTTHTEKVPGIPVKLMDWKKREMFRFDRGVPKKLIRD